MWYNLLAMPICFSEIDKFDFDFDLIYANKYLLKLSVLNNASETD